MSSFTESQKIALRQAALNEPSIQTAILLGDDTTVTNWFNTPSSFIVWRTDVSQSEILLSTAFDWTRVDNLSNGKARIWDWMFRQGTIDASQANIRAGIAAVWVGTAADLVVREAVLTLCKRQATNTEKVLATGIGSDIEPGILTFEGIITSDNVAFILRG